ncbi:hypothetical protein [Streptomyces sp. NPDC002855]|uniref:hypothetical protein n=1 Tax=Streptomyces sp. NPDC002855 TaxID=3154437 RepID=UPI0033311AA7
MTDVPVNPYLHTFAQDAFQVAFVHDGTNTIAELVLTDAYGGPGRVIARGVARRRKSDQRNMPRAEGLALARMFKDAADYYAKHARKHGGEPFPKPVRKRGDLAARLERAVEQAKAGETKDLGDFTEYADELKPVE